MITIIQIRAARALLGLTIDELSAQSGIAPDIIRSIEASDGRYADQAHVLTLKQALEARGVTFFADGDCPPGGEGVRLTARHDQDDGIRPENLNATNDG